jgi:aminoglycoside 3-N-acetyltransferase
MERILQLVKDLRQLGVEAEDTIVVHSSYKALLGGVQQGDDPAWVIDALKETVKHGTLMFPTLTYETVTPEMRKFDVRNTPSCVGILPEVMRTMPDVYRSVHPTHSIAVWGKDAREIAEAHMRDFTPVGANSPLHEVYRRDGKIIMLGCGLRPNTSMHGVEELVAPPYLYGKNCDYTLALHDGRRITKAYLNHGFAHVTHRYDRIVDLLAEDGYRAGKVLYADCTVLQARAMWEAGLRVLREDPLYFVDQKES